MGVKMNRIKIKSNILSVIGIFLLVLLDQISKMLAASKLKGKESVIVIPKILSLTYLENEGAAWGIFQNKQIFFIVISVVLLICIALYNNKLPYTSRFRALRITMAVLASGAIGNMIDRIVHKYVIDFFEFKFISFPVFNVADIYVTCSVIFLLILTFFVYSEKELFLERERNEKN